MNQEDSEKMGISCLHDRTGNGDPKRKTVSFRSAVPVEGLVAQRVVDLACVVGAVKGGEVRDHSLAVVNVRNLRGEVGCHNQDQVGASGRALASSVVVGGVQVLGEVVLHQGVTETSDQGP